MSTQTRSDWSDENGHPCVPPPLPVSLKEPKLWTTNPTKIHPRVFAIPLLPTDMIRFVEEKIPEDDSAAFEKQAVFMKRFHKFFPPRADRLAYRRSSQEQAIVGSAGPGHWYQP
ncbi:hypothetical protein CC1G_10761 [Coprinopsis cinerea okayama7|uniref:Uncharacterized protein n=1 Tax=Coprinopsis cinerea (strain Okayama-7 / 130 / ATCC MYA-4618 / FGSC 9003) TaxID=240176 RepID=A8P3C2_COPC7|nr:hypothetical protein CC1G_10761 [Coprinopsis cinerea okayama7\|eukprot:XP_001838519.2 hypothetical protein CC1G_10761 [Coprinopsis cinerea okayama7\